MESTITTVTPPIDAAWLQTLCLAGHYSELLAQPWLLSEDCPYRTAVTNGYLALFLRDSVDGLVLGDKVKVTDRLTFVLEPKGDRHEVDVKALMAFIGQYKPPTRCDECHGCGNGECPTCGSDDFECAECGGSGKIEAERRLGVIFGVTLNLSVLAKFIERLPVDGVLIVTTTGKPETPVWIDSPSTWRLVAQGMETMERDMPRFDG